MENKNKYSFNKSSKKYKTFFNNEKNKIEKILPKASIQHVGSSSVEGLCGKGIIDIAVSVPKKQIENTIKKFEKNKYSYKPSAGDKERFFLERTIKYNGTERRVHIQLTHKDSKSWKSMLAVRDYLRANPKDKLKYREIKKKAVIYAKQDGKKYRDYKKDFLNKIEKKALEVVHKNLTFERD